MHDNSTSDRKRLILKSKNSLRQDSERYAATSLTFWRRPPVSTIRVYKSDVIQYYDRDTLRFSSRQRGHVAGMMSLMQFQNPESYSEPSRHQIFIQLRQFWVRNIRPHLLSFRSPVVASTLYREPKRHIPSHRKVVEGPMARVA